jgi:hypothetical protein
VCDGAAGDLHAARIHHADQRLRVHEVWVCWFEWADRSNADHTLTIHSHTDTLVVLHSRCSNPSAPQPSYKKDVAKARVDIRAKVAHKLHEQV